MNTCELCELEMSAIADGEVDTNSLTTALDHLVECASCREFYRSARAIDAVVARGKVTPPPERVWRRIEAEAHGGVLPFPTRRALGWAARVAAVGLVAAGLWAIGALRIPSMPLGHEVEVRLESNRGAMSDERFVKMTTELLQSDRKYHRKMLEILTVVNSRMLVDEGAAVEQDPVLESTVLAANNGDVAEEEGAERRPSDRQIYW